MKIKNKLIHAGIMLVFTISIGACEKKAAPVAQQPTTALPNYSFTAGGITVQGIQYTVSNPVSGPIVITGANASNNTTGYQMIQITISGGGIQTSGTTTFTLNTPAGSANGGIGQYTIGSPPSTTYNTDAIHTGIATLTVDMTAKQMSVTFNYNTIQYNTAVTSTLSVSGSFKNIGFQ
jgi:hypothetical protein